MERFYCGYTKFYEAAPLYMPCGLEFVQIIQAVLPLWQHISLYLQNFGASRAVAGASRSLFRKKKRCAGTVFPHFSVFFRIFRLFSQTCGVLNAAVPPPKQPCGPNAAAPHSRADALPAFRRTGPCFTVSAPRKGGLNARALPDSTAPPPDRHIPARRTRAPDTRRYSPYPRPCPARSWSLQ